MRTGAITLGEIAATLPMLGVECSRCGRHGRYSTAKLVERFGAEEPCSPLHCLSLKLLPQGVSASDHAFFEEILHVDRPGNPGSEIATLPSVLLA